MRFCASIALVVLLLPGFAGAVDITACGQVVEAGEVGVLQSDLGCAGGLIWPFTALGVRLRPGATLELNGFTIAGNGTGVGVECATVGGGPRPRCTIRGPGEIRGFWSGVNCGGCRVVASDVALRANENAIYIPLAGRLLATRVVVSDNLDGGIVALSVRGDDVEASRNGGIGVSASTWLQLRNLHATANGAQGVRAGTKPSRLVDSTVLGNGTAGEGYDITSVARVRLVRTTCARSAKLRLRRGGTDEMIVVGSFGCTDD